LLAGPSIDLLLGETVLKTLNATQVVDGSTYDEKSVIRNRLALVGEKTNKGFEAKAKHLGVAMEGDTVTVTPSAYDASHGGWYRFLADKASKAQARADVVQELILRKVADCE